MDHVAKVGHRSFLLVGLYSPHGTRTRRFCQLAYNNLNIQSAAPMAWPVGGLGGGQ